MARVPRLEKPRKQKGPAHVSQTLSPNAGRMFLWSEQNGELPPFCIRNVDYWSVSLT